jgi:[ribosomal protein S18]-alanine N-acetyltransferase
VNPQEEGVQIQIRPMTVADLARVMEIAASLPDAPHWPQSAYLAALDPGSTPRRIALVAVDPQTEHLQGLTIANLVLPQAELETIAVDAAYQRRELGRRLFDALVCELRAAGAHEIVLEVRASNHAALGFYRSVGFGKTGLRKGYYTDPVDDAVLMKLRFG